MSSCTEDQVHQLAERLAMAGWTAADLILLGQYHRLGDIRDILRGGVEVKAADFSIDCDADPFVPEGWSVVEHRKGGIVKWTESLIGLHLSEGQKNGRWIEGNKLRKALKDQKVLNATVLDRLLAHPHLIPEEWKNKRVFFWGTVYSDSSGFLRVRSLLWRGGRWDWGAHWLDDDWDDDGPAAVPAS